MCWNLYFFLHFIPCQTKLTSSVLGKLSNRKSGKTWDLVKKSEKSQVICGKISKLGGGGLWKSKKAQFPESIKEWQIMTHFHLMRTQKPKILSIIVLNMTKYTTISLSWLVVPWSTDGYWAIGYVWPDIVWIIYVDGISLLWISGDL